MERLSGRLRRLLGRARFGLYALPREGSPVLIASSPDWRRTHPAVSDILRSGDPAPIGEPRRAAVDMILMRIDEGATLLVHAGPRAAVWAMGAKEWSRVARQIAAAAREGNDGRPPGHDAPTRFHETLLAEIPLGVLRCDATGRATYMNSLAEEILGIVPGEGIGSDCLAHFETPGLEENPIVLGLKGKLNRFEMYMSDREGRERPAWVQMARIHADDPGDSGGSATEMLVLLRDTSDERAFDDEMRRRERLASIGELSAGVAHEIRNPLTGIANCAQVLRDRILPDDPRLRFVQIILDEAARLNRIVDSLLTFARPPRPQLKESDLGEVVRRAFDLELGALAAAGISCDMNIRGRIPRIYVDPEQILQVLLNVMRNAAESMPGGGKLSLECFIVRRRPHIRRGVGQRSTDRFRQAGNPPAAAYLQVRISDTGRGIPQDVLPRIFDPFFTTRPKGTGLGLSISQSIIIEHGGFISVRSVQERGTTVSIDLPVERRSGERRREVI